MISLRRGMTVFGMLGLLGLVVLGSGCSDSSGIGSGQDGSTNNNSGLDAALTDGALPDGAVVNDAQADAWVRPPGDAFVLPENPYDAFVHPAQPFGPAMVLNTLSIQSAAGGLGPFAGVVNPEIQTALDQGNLLLVVEFLDLASTSGVIDDPDVTLVLYRAADADADPSNNFDGSGQFFVDIDTATVIAGASVSNGAVLVPAGTFQYLGVDVPGLGELVIMDPELSFTVGTNFSGLSDGEITGGVPSRSLDVLPNETGFGNPNGTVLDLLAASIFGVQPDVDIDGDGQLETYEDQSPNSPSLDESISICYDYFGVFDDDGCPQYPEIWDGYSVGLDFTAVPATIAGALP